MALEQLFLLLDIDQEEFLLYETLDDYIIQKLVDHYSPFSDTEDPIQKLADSDECPKIKGLTSEMIEYFQGKSILTPEEEEKIIKNPHLLVSFQDFFELYLPGDKKEYNHTVLVFLTGVKNHRPTFQISTTHNPDKEGKYEWCSEGKGFIVDDFGAELKIYYLPHIGKEGGGSGNWVVELFNTLSHVEPTITPGLGLFPYPLRFENCYYKFDTKFTRMMDYAFKNFRRWLRS